MNDGFLSRWSRRKRQADAGEVPRDAVHPASPGPLSPSECPSDPIESAVPVASARAEGTPIDEKQADGMQVGGAKLDLAQLPPLESITAETDIRGFLAPGVPAELRNEALRRAWVADPKVRDFVGLAEYDWDFNAANAMTGFGPLPMTDDLRREVMRIVSGWQGQAQSPADVLSDGVAPPPAAVQTEQRGVPPAAGPVRGIAACAGDQNVLPGADNMHYKENAVTHKTMPAKAAAEPDPAASALPTRRSHGGALPQ